MLRDKDLTTERSDVFIKCEKGESLTLFDLRELIKKTADGYQIPVAFGEDQIQSGGILNKTAMDCLIMFHPEHPNDYFHNAITMRKQGLMHYMSVYYYGTSKQFKNAAAAASAKDSLRDSLTGRGDGFAMAGAVISGLKSIGRNKAKFQEEEDYYHALAQIFNEALGGTSYTY